MLSNGLEAWKNLYGPCPLPPRWLRAWYLQSNCLGRRSVLSASALTNLLKSGDNSDDKSEELTLDLPFPPIFIIVFPSPVDEYIFPSSQWRCFQTYNEQQFGRYRQYWSTTGVWESMWLHSLLLILRLSTRLLLYSQRTLCSSLSNRFITYFIMLSYWNRNLSGLKHLTALTPCGKTIAETA